ncbi:MAG TPA: protein kinase [Thermoanaerobaculia bacterium]|nr:protein kinase [Thermoanaerobaculia bacterium]
MTSLLIALSVGAAVAATYLLVQRISRGAALESIQSSSSVQSAFRERDYQQLKLIARLMASDPYLVAYLAEAAENRDAASILDLLTERQKDFGYGFAAVLDANGRVVARTDRPAAAGQDLSGRALVAKVRTEFEAQGVWREGDELDYAVAVPIAQDFTPVGYLVTGFPLPEAESIAEISGADMAFVTDDAAGPRVVATTLPPGVSRNLAAALRSQEEGMGEAMRAGKVVPELELTLDGEPWIALQTPLTDAAGKPVGASIALASLARPMAAYREIETALLAVGLAVVLLGPLLAFAFARRALAPMRRLLTATEAARQGDYDQKIAVTGRTDEVGRLANAFDELLADLREKRDMEAYVTELSRNLPEPAQGRAVPGAPQTRDVLLLAIELRRYVRAAASLADGLPQDTLDLLAVDLERITSAITAQRGQVEAIAGHRVVARFEGEGRALRALSAAARVLGEGDDDPDAEADAPAVAMASGRAVAGPVSWGDRLERALVGLPVQQVEGLLREATPGEAILSRDVHEELREALEQAGYRLAERRGILSTQPLYAVGGRMATRVVSTRGAAGAAGATGSGAGTETVAPAGAATLSGIAPGALMGQRFEILSVLGVGGMGVVYKARDRELDDLVALKMMKREMWGDRTQLERLKSELKLARKITHPNVLRTHDFGEIDGIPYISMEYVRGVTLRYLLDQQASRLPYSAGLRVAKQLCAGLGAAHSVGVIHRDIKPENLILEPTGNAKLMDFGIARPVVRAAPGQTQAGFIVGTPQYLSPEQLQGREPDTRADIYSCGMVFYEMFTGELPFTGATAVEIAMKHLQVEPEPPSVRWREVPPALDVIILRCLAKDPDARYRSVQDLLRELEALSA